MNRFSVVVATAVLAATMTTQAETAEAGFLRRLIHHRLHHHHGHRHLFHHRHRRFVYVAPIVAAPVVAAPVYRQPTYPVAQPVQPPVVRNADGMGRVYDPTNMAWTDGRNQCWSGRQAWSFRNGSWFYGNDTWYPANGTWLTNAADAPTPVDCQTIPAFAQAGPSMPGVARNDTPARPSESKDYDVTGASVCKKYFSNVGQMVTVPCE